MVEMIDSRPVIFRLLSAPFLFCASVNLAQLAILSNLCLGTDSYPVFLTVTDIRPEAGRTTEVQRWNIIHDKFLFVVFLHQKSLFIYLTLTLFLQSCWPCQESGCSSCIGERYCSQGERSTNLYFSFTCSASQIFHIFGEILYERNIVEQEGWQVCRFSESPTLSPS